MSSDAVEDDFETEIEEQAELEHAEGARADAAAVELAGVVAWKLVVAFETEFFNKLLRSTIVLLEVAFSWCV